MDIGTCMGGNRRREHRIGLLEKLSMSSATDLTKAWLESLPTEVDDPMPAARVPYRSTDPRTLDARDNGDAVLLSTSVSVHPLRRPQSRGDASNHDMRSSVKVSTSTKSTSGAAGRSGKVMTSQPTYDESGDVDEAFQKLLGDFSVPRKTADMRQIKNAEARCASSPQELEDCGRDRKTSGFIWSRSSVISERATGHRKLPLPGGGNQSNTRRERSKVTELTDEVNREERQATGRRHSEKDMRNLQCYSRRPSLRGPVKANYEIQCRSQDFCAQMPSVSASAAINDSTFRKQFRNSVATSADRASQPSRDFATQTFGQMLTTSVANSEAQTEISAMTKSDEVLKHSLVNSRERSDDYFSQNSLQSRKRDVILSRDNMAADDRRRINGFSKCRTNSSKSLYTEFETSQKSTNRLLNESCDNCVEKWSKKDIRSAESVVVDSNRFDVHSKGIVATVDTSSVKSRSLSGTGNSRRLMSLMLEEVKALKSVVQTHLDERQTTDQAGSSQTRARQKLEEKDPDSDSAVELAIIDKTAKKRDSEKSHRSHKSSKSRRQHSRHRRTEDEENKDERRPRKRSPAREKTWDDIRRRNSVEDSNMRSRYLSTAEGRGRLGSVGGVSAAYDAFPAGDSHPSNFHRFIPGATGVNSTAATVYQSPFQLYQNRNPFPFHGYAQPSTMPTSYQPDRGHLPGGYTPVNFNLHHPSVYSMPAADHAYPLRIPFPNSVGVHAAPAMVDPAMYAYLQQAAVRPALTFVPAGVTPLGQTMQTEATLSAWNPRGQFATKDNETKTPNTVTTRREDLRVRRGDSSARNSQRGGSQSRKPANSLDDALREAQGIRSLTERLGKDTRGLPSYSY